MAILILFERTFGRSRSFFLNRCRCIHLHFNTSLLQPRFHSQIDWPLKHHLGGNRWFNCPRFLKCPPETTTSTFSIPQISLWQEQKGKFHPLGSIATTPRVKKALPVKSNWIARFSNNTGLPWGSVYTNAVSHQHGFTTSKPRQNRCGLKGFTRNRFPQKIKVVMVKATPARHAEFTILNRTMQLTKGWLHYLPYSPNVKVNLRDSHVLQQFDAFLYRIN